MPTPELYDAVESIAEAIFEFESAPPKWAELTAEGRAHFRQRALDALYADENKSALDLLTDDN